MLDEVAVFAPLVAVRVYIPADPVNLHPAKVETPEVLVETGLVVQDKVGPITERVIAVPDPSKFELAS